jgi:hypothetical protein
LKAGLQIRYNCAPVGCPAPTHNPKLQGRNDKQEEKMTIKTKKSTYKSCPISITPQKITQILNDDRSKNCRQVQPLEEPCLELAQSLPE